MIQELLTEKLRPKELKHMILPKRIKGSFENGLQQNVLLAGSPGSGKTSMAKILIKNNPHLFINVSDESSVETIRTKIHDFCSTVSIMEGEKVAKIVVLDECLEINEKIRIGTIDNWKPVKLADLEKDTLYECVSFNMETGELENDTCMIISEREADLYEVELETGEKIIVTDNHPFIVSENGKFVEKSISQNLSSSDSVVVFS